MDQGVRRARGHPLAHQRMHDRVQSLPSICVIEHKLAQACAVDPIVVDVLGAEFPLDQVKAQAPRLVDGVSGLVGVEHRGAELAQHLRHGRLPRPGAARQPNELQLA